MKQRFTLDRRSFEQFIAAVSLLQPLQHAASKIMSQEKAPLLLYLLETLRGIDSGTLAVQATLDRVAEFALHIVGGDSAVLWLFTNEDLTCRAAAGMILEDAHVSRALRSKLQSAGAFGKYPPATLDLTTTLARYSGSLGSSLGIAVLPGGNVAGALAVFSTQSRTFTEQDYANLRLLAGLAQYVLKKGAGEGELKDSLEEDAVTLPLLQIPSPFSAERSARTPLYVAPFPDHTSGPIERPSASRVDRQVEFGDMNGRQTIGTGLPSLSSSAALDAWRQIQGLAVTALSATKIKLRRFRNIRMDMRALSQAVPAFAILAVMSLFAGLLTGGRRPLENNTLGTTAEAATTTVMNKASSNVNQDTAVTIVPKKSTGVPVESSHRRITDRETAATIAELSRYEVRNLQRAADYGDDLAALQLGMLYELGRGFPQSCSQAAKWVTKAAEAGNAAAEYNLGLRYRDGDGVDANEEQAKNWLRRAAAHKNVNAAGVLDQLASQ